MNTHSKNSFKNKCSVLVLGLKHLNQAVLIRSIFIALIIGAMLTLSNQNSAVFGEENFITMQLLLAFITPFFVVTLSQLSAIYQADIDKRSNKVFSVSERFKTTVLTHNIIFRSLVISLFVGSVSSVIVLTTILAHPEDENIAWLLVIQSYVLPFLFSVLSQALAYRRSITQ